MIDIDRATAILQRLSAQKAEMAMYFLELLALKDEIEATEEIKADPELAASIWRAREARRDGRTDQFVDWDARHRV